MMKAQITNTGGHVSIQVSGRLTGEWANELDICWRSARASGSPCNILVDLQHVTFIDEAGRALLKRMYREGAKFRAAGLMTREIIDNIIRNEEKSDCI